jgi:hypothetical protein
MPDLTDDVRSLCGVINPDGTDCTAPVMDGAPVNICAEHMMQAYLHVRDLIVTRDGELGADGRVYDAWHQPDTCFVYYVRQGDKIKIGYTWNLWARMNKIPGMLLAIEPGDRETERQRHQQFAAVRVGRNAEWFTGSPDLMAHIRALRQRYGDPVERRYDPETGRLRPLWRLLLDTTPDETPRRRADQP